MSRFGPLLVALVVILVLLGCGLFSCATTSAPMDKYTLVYHGGPLDSRDYIKQIPPGQGLTYIGWLQNTYEYPSTERTYLISKNPDEGDVKGKDFIAAKSKDSNIVEIQTMLTFHLNPDPKVLREFHEKFGLKYSAWTDEGWRNLLRERVRQPMLDAYQREAKKYSIIEATGPKMSVIGDDVADTIQADIDRSMGGHYIIVGKMSVTNIDPDPNVQQSIEAVVKAQQDAVAAQNRVAAAKLDAEASRIRAEALSKAGGMESVLQNAVDKGAVKLILVPYDLKNNINISDAQ